MRKAGEASVIVARWKSCQKTRPGARCGTSERQGFRWMRSGDAVQRLAVGVLSDVISYETMVVTNTDNVATQYAVRSLTVVCGRSSQL